MTDHPANEIRRKAREAMAPVARKFLVVGPHAVAGKVKGETVDIELTESQADALTSGGHVIEVPEGYTATPEPTKPDAPLVEYTEAEPAPKSNPQADKKPGKNGPQLPEQDKG